MMTTVKIQNDQATTTHSSVGRDLGDIPNPAIVLPPEGWLEPQNHQNSTLEMGQESHVGGNREIPDGASHPCEAIFTRPLFRTTATQLDRALTH